VIPLRPRLLLAADSWRTVSSHAFPGSVYHRNSERWSCSPPRNSRAPGRRRRGLPDCARAGSTVSAAAITSILDAGTIAAGEDMRRSWVERQFASSRPVGVSSRAARLVERAESVSSWSRRRSCAERRVEEREILELTEPQRLHRRIKTASDERRFPGRCARRLSNRFRRRGGNRSRHHPSATPGALLRRRLRDPLDLQLLDMFAVARTLDLARGRCHDERMLGTVSEVSATLVASTTRMAAARGNYTRMLLRGLARIKRQDLDAPA